MLIILHGQEENGDNFGYSFDLLDNNGMFSFWEKWMCPNVEMKESISETQNYENTPIQIYWNFYHQKWTFSDKKF